MSAVVVRNLPAALHRKLKEQAERHHRSMNREAIAILERELGRPTSAESHPPMVGLNKPVSGEWIVQIIRDARDGKR